MTITAYANINDWTAIHNMTFMGNSHQLNAERLRIPSGNSLTVTYGQESFTQEPFVKDAWSNEAVENVRQSAKFAELAKKWEDRQKERHDKALKAGKTPVQKWPKIIFEYKARSMPSKERKPILPLTPEQEAARIARNRAKLGLV